jgi:hypothetical protein
MASAHVRTCARASIEKIDATAGFRLWRCALGCKGLDMHNFTPWSALAGGILVGLAASILLLVSGRVAGISGILVGVLLPQRGEVGWRLAFLAGLLLAGIAAMWVDPSTLGSSPRSLPVLLVAGLLVGAGTRLGAGCTSGHGVCGLSRASPRSLVATCVFVVAGIVTATLVRLLAGGS